MKKSKWMGIDANGVKLIIDLENHMVDIYKDGFFVPFENYSVCGDNDYVFDHNDELVKPMEVK